MAAPTIHVLSKSDYSSHKLITLPTSSIPSEPLAPSSLRLRSRILSLTTNNLTYARFGVFIGWWDLYHLPTSTPEPYNDAEQYGRISAWGYAEVIDSTVDGIEKGKSVYGYLPIGTLPVDVSVSATGFQNQFIVTSPHRQHLWKIYNRLDLCDQLPSSLLQSPEIEGLGWDSLLQPLFGTGYNMNRYAFSWTPEHVTHPSGNGDWSLEDANIKDVTLIVLNASGKTALSFAHQVKNNRPKEQQPKALIAVSSSTSRPFVQNTKFYDDALLYEDVEGFKSNIEHASASRLILLDFGARTGSREDWDNSLKTLAAVIGVKYTFISVGAEVKVQSAEEVGKRFTEFGNTIQVNANELREKGILIAGNAYFEEFQRVFGEFKKGGAIPGVHLNWEQGMEEWEKGWEALCEDKIGADTGLVYWLGDDFQPLFARKRV